MFGHDYISTSNPRPAPLRAKFLVANAADISSAIERYCLAAQYLFEPLRSTTAYPVALLFIADMSALTANDAPSLSHCQARSPALQPRSSPTQQQSDGLPAQQPTALNAVSISQRQVVPRLTDEQIAQQGLLSFTRWIRRYDYDVLREQFANELDQARQNYETRHREDEKSLKAAQKREKRLQSTLNEKDTSLTWALEEIDAKNEILETKQAKLDELEARVVEVTSELDKAKEDARAANQSNQQLKLQLTALECLAGDERDQAQRHIEGVSQEKAKIHEDLERTKQELVLYKVTLDEQETTLKTYSTQLKEGKMEKQRLVREHNVRAIAGFKRANLT